jgi:hypothetical protein
MMHPLVQDGDDADVAIAQPTPVHESRRSGSLSLMEREDIVCGSWFQHGAGGSGTKRAEPSSAGIHSFEASIYPLFIEDGSLL